MSLHQNSATVVADAEFVSGAIAALPPAFNLLSTGSKFVPINTNRNWASGLGKRSFDLLIALPALAFLAPLLAVIALLVRLDSKGPVLFRQRRAGIGGRGFDILKFRSMRVLENGDTVVQASQDDPRTTRVGRWLRRTSLDELPQLINVVRGDMSLVGPRPHARAHDLYYAEKIAAYGHRHSVKPGITGWAQVNGYRGPTPTLDVMARRIDCDVWYARHASFVLDLKILLRTPLEVLRSRNAF